MSEKLKAQIVRVSEARSKDALAGVDRSPLQDFIDRGSAGPYRREEVYIPEVQKFLADPSQVSVITCGRNEHQRGNLGPTLKYALASTGTHQNVVYIDARSTDGSPDVARALGVHTIERNDALEDWFNTDRLAELMCLPKDALYRDVPGFTPMRKGIDVMLARVVALRNGSENDIFIDSDLKTIPGGDKAHLLSPHQIYHPIQNLARSYLDLNQAIPGDQTPMTIYTGSGERNNEPIMAVYNAYLADATSPFKDEDQQRIARAFFAMPATLMHLLTGELIVSNRLHQKNGAPSYGSELDVMNATGQATESARTLSQAGFALKHFGNLSSEALANQYPFFGNSRRGEQLRIDEPQLDDKEWWMIAGLLPQFIRGVGDYCIAMKKLPHELAVEDYPKLNAWLANINECSYGDKVTQTRVSKRSPMERAIPPISLMIEEGILKI